MRRFSHTDFFAVAVADNKQDADWHLNFMKANIDCKGKIMGLGAGESREEKFLKRTVRVDEAGWEYEADQRHVEIIVEQLGLTADSKGVATGTSGEVSLSLVVRAAGRHSSRC